MNENKIGIKVPEILLPKVLDVKTWAVIACDQYTQDIKYWDEVEELVKKVPSTLYITLPEIHLGDPDKEERIAAIKQTMKSYVASDVFKSFEGFVYVKRKTKSGVRQGLVLALDLEEYEYEEDKKSLIRPTEKTIVSRIPPRVKIRQGAALECPHIMTLMNDKKNRVFEYVQKVVQNKGEEPVYKGKLMMGGGEVEGYAITEKEDIEGILAEFSKLKEESLDKDGKAFLFAVGDGNHSLATAKKVWENYKSEHKGVVDNPLRYALCEVVNLYEDALKFSAIHRVLFCCDAKKLVDFMEWEFGDSAVNVSTFDILEAYVRRSKSKVGFAYCNEGEIHYKLLDIGNKGTLTVTRLQRALDEYLITQKSTSVDYIHDEKQVMKLTSANRNADLTCTTLGILLPPIQKESLFDTIESRGVLPRKSFSMGTAVEKRYYMECRGLE